MKTFDLIVIGSGAGLNVANEVARSGKKVAIVEKGPMGGTCLNRGCIPSKIVIHSADVAETVRNAAKFGITANITNIDLPSATKRASMTVDKSAVNIETALKGNRNPTLIKGTATFTGKNTIKVNNKTFKGKKILIAVGARPFIPPIPGLDKVKYMTSTEALRLKKAPKHLVVIGGGYIGVELGFFYAGMGTKITVIQRNIRLIPREDGEIAQLVTDIWKKKYNVITKAYAHRVEQNGKAITVHVKKGNKEIKVTGDALLVATGVKPYSDTLNLEKTGVKTNKRGYIHVNKFLETSAKNIYALGDVAGVYLFRHSANLEARYVTNNILYKKRAVDYYPIPHAIFTDPQVAGVGLTEEQALERKKDYVIGKYYYKNTGMGQALQETEGFAKFIVDKKTKEIIGFHIIGPQASTAIHEVLIAMKAGKKKALDLIRETIHIHPALSEVVQRAANQVPV